MKRIDDAELLAWLDGELSSERRAEIQAQLETDWELRTTLAQLERRIGKYIEATAHQSPPDIEPFDDFWQRLSPQLTALSAAPATAPQTASFFVRVKQWLGAEPYRLRLASATALTLLLSLGLLVYLSISPRLRPVSAEELLERSIQSETQPVRQLAEPVIYRKLQVKRIGTDARVATVMWESWRDPLRNQMRQRTANAPETQADARADAKAASAVLAELANVLRANQMDAQHPLSAAAFAAWRNRIQRQTETVVRNRDGLTLTTTAAAPHARNAIIEAALTVRPNDWHVVALQLQVQGEPTSQRFELHETAYAVLPAQALASVAEATPTLEAGAPSPWPSPSLSPGVSPSTSPTASVAAASIASAALEVEVLERLNQVNALLGEQLNLTRTPNGQLKVEGIVETDTRKAELLRALQAVVHHPAVKVEINTVAEAQARQAPSSQARQVIIQDAQVTQQAIPVETELRNYFSPRGLTGERLEQEMQRFSAQICSRSSRARAHALALKQIADRFTATQLPTLDQTTRERWRALLQQHAQGYRREWQQLRQQLQPIFAGAAETGAANSKLNSDDELLGAISQLFKLAATNDAALCQSFSVSTETTSAAVKRADFWRAVSTAEHLATQIAAWQ